MSVRHFYSDGPHHARYGLRPTAAREWRVAGAQGSLQAEAQPRTAGSRVAAVHEYNPDSAEAPTARREGGAFSPLETTQRTRPERSDGRVSPSVQWAIHPARYPNMGREQPTPQSASGRLQGRSSMEGQRLGAERSALPVAVQLPTPQLQRCSRVPSTTSGEQRAGIQPEAMPQGFEVAADTRRNDNETEQLRERLRAALEANERLQEQLVERAQADGGLPLSSASSSAS